MSNPFAVNPGRSIYDPNLSPLSGLAKGLAGVLQAQQEREKLAREREEFASKQAYFATLNEGNQLENEQKRRRLKDEERKLKAKEQGLTAYNTYVGGGDLSQILSGLKDPDAISYLLDQVKNQANTNQAIAQARASTVGADVSEATKGDEITKSKAGAETAQNQATITGAQAAEAPAQEKAQTRNMQLQGQKLLQDLQQPAGGIDPARINAATQAYRSGGLTLGQAFETAGVPLPAGVNPDQKFEVQTRGMAMRKAEQKSAAMNSLIAHEQMEQLIGDGTRLTIATAIKDAIPFDAGQGKIPPDQQQLIASAGQFVSQYVLSVSGKAATDAERRYLVKQIAPRAGDSQKVQMQRTIMREAMIQIMKDASQGSTAPPSEIIRATIAVARQKGADPNALRFLEESMRKARVWEQQSSKLDAIERPDGGNQGPLVVDPTMMGMDSAQAYLDALGR